MASKKYAKVNTKRCVACGVCVKECPKSAIHIFKGCFAVIDEEICLGCENVLEIVLQIVLKF